MATRRNEEALGDVDGTNTVFATQADYRPGTLLALVNGQVIVAVELGGIQFELPNPPKAGSVVSVRYTVAG